MHSQKRFSSTTLLAGLFCFAALTFASVHAQAQTSAATSSSGQAANSQALESAPSWKSLTPAQQTALKPMQADWSALDANRKKKWLAVAQRYQTMSTVDQTRMHERMAQWSKLSPAQRSAARDNYSAVLSSPNTTGSVHSDAAAKANLNEQWTKYQALSPEKKSLLTEQANKVDAGKSKPLSSKP